MFISEFLCIFPSHTPESSYHKNKTVTFFDHSSKLGIAEKYTQLYLKGKKKKKMLSQLFNIHLLDF